MKFPTPAPAESTELLQHLALERISAQWSGFLAVLSDELQAQLSADEYRALLGRLGARFAQSFELPECDSLAQMEEAANKVWGPLSWGYATFSDSGRQLLIEHHACPLPAALQVETELAAGFLEGVYATWLAAAGSPEELALGYVSDDSKPMYMSFELAAR